MILCLKTTAHAIIPLTDAAVSTVHVMYYISIHFGYDNFYISKVVFLLQDIPIYKKAATPVVTIGS